MPIKITNRTVSVHQDSYDFMPRWKLEAAEYEKVKITSVDEKPESRFGQQDKQRIIKMSGDIGEPLTHWPRIPITDEIMYYEFLDKIVDPKTNKFYPARDEERGPLPKTGAMHVKTDLIRLETADEGEFLLSKGYIIGRDAAGQEVSHYVPWLERWFKTLFRWESEYNNNTKQFQKMCLGPIGAEEVRTLKFNKQNVKDSLNFAS